MIVENCEVMMNKNFCFFSLFLFALFSLSLPLSFSSSLPPYLFLYVQSKKNKAEIDVLFWDGN